MIIKGNSVGYPLPDPRKGLEMQGGINMNGQALKGLNAPTANDEAANKGYVDSKLSMELLWENASPTSEFAAQTISLDLSEYNRVVVYYCGNSTGSYSEDKSIKIGKSSYLTWTRYPQTGDVMDKHARIAKVSTTGIEFNHGTRKGYNSQVVINDNAAIIPIGIYGIKGVLA